MILRKSDRRSAARRGFTLMEVLVVVAILVILAGAASIYVFRFLEEAKVNRARADVQTISRACESFKVGQDRFPESLQELLTPPSGQPYFSTGNAIVDPWNNPYKYDMNGARNGGLKPDIWTVSPDGVEIGNWGK